MARIQAPTGGSPATDDGQPPGTAVPNLVGRLQAFRSLGGNCEFGFVQRYCGAEPSGLFRFSFTPLDALIHGLETDFAAYGAPGDLRVEAHPSGTYYCRSEHANIWANTARRLGEIDPDTLLEREYGRIAHLKRHMLDELAQGSKILVRKVGLGESEADIARLAGAIRRHGPSTLLLVDAAGSDDRAPPVRRIAEGILAGSVQRFAPDERAWDLDLEPWLRLCDGAYAVRDAIPATAFPKERRDAAMGLAAWVRLHRGRARAPGLRTFRTIVDPARFDPERIYVFWAWVLIPAEFSGTRVFALAGRERLGSRDADLTIRDRWQRVWVAGRIRPETRPPVGLAVIGSRRDHFWSCDWHLHEGPFPAPAQPPGGLLHSAFARLLPRRSA